MSAPLSNIVRDNDRINPTAALHVEVVADFVCPFSFVGKRHLDEALQAVKGPSDVSWYPFQLNPDIPPEGLPFDVYLTKRFGTPASRAARRWAGVGEVIVSFGSAGIFAFKMDGQPIWQRQLGRMRTRYGWGEATSAVLADDLVGEIMGVVGIDGLGRGIPDTR